MAEKRTQSRKIWSDKEKAILKKVYPTASDDEILKSLPGRNWESIGIKASRMKLSRVNRGLGFSWSDEEEKILKKFWLTEHSQGEIEKELPRHNWNAIRLHASLLGLELRGREKRMSETAEKLPQESVDEQVSERMKQLFGEVSLKPHQLPHLDASKPHEINSKKGEILILNSPLIGSLVAEDEYIDIVKNSLRLAEASKCDAIIVTGNLMYMLAQRYGTHRPYKTQVSGVKVNAKKVEAGYPKSVVNHPEFRSIEKRLERGEVVFVTMGQRLDHNLDMLHKTFIDDKGKSLYSGSVYITFGKLEDELIMFYANEFLRVDLFKSRAWAQKRVYECTSKWAKEKDQAIKDEVYKELLDWKRWLNIFVVLSNSADESIDKKREMVTAYLIKRYEESIPNSKVISVGDAFIKINSRNIMITTDKHRNVSSGKLSTWLLDKTESYSKGRKPGNIPNVMLGMGLNPFFDVKFVTYQASDEPRDKRTCTIIQLPMCIDAERYRDVIRNQNILKDNITRVGQESGFESGVITLRWHEGVSQPVIESWTSNLLKNKEIFKSEKNIQNLVDGKKIEHRLMYGHKRGCTHYGASDVMRYDSPNDPNGVPVKYHYQVAMEFLLAANAPILTDQHDGDITQGANHPYWKNVHPEYLLPEYFLEKAKEIESSNDSCPEKFKKLKKLALDQKICEGIFQPDEQVKGYVKSLKPYLDYFLQIISRKNASKLSFNGRLSAIMHIMGNHCKNTYKTSDVFVSDALNITEQLKKLLFAHLINKKDNGLQEYVENELTAPQHGPLGEARGSFGIQGYQLYAMILKHKQGEIDKTQKKSQKRSMNEHEVGLPIINLSGDNHKGGIRITRGIVNIKTGGQQDEGAYGREIDGSEQNVFSLVYGVPVGGFAFGPVVFVILDTETMRRYALKPFAVNGKKLFRNAIE